MSVRSSSETQSTFLSSNFNTKSTSTTSSTTTTEITIPIGKNYDEEKMKSEIGGVISRGELSNEIAGANNSDKDILNGFYNKVDNLEDVQEDPGIKNFLSGAVGKVKSMFNNKTESTKTSDVKGSELAKNMSKEDIQQSLNYVASHTDGIDNESADFKALPKNVQNYIVATANDVKTQKSNVENSSDNIDNKFQLKPIEAAIN